MQHALCVWYKYIIINLLFYMYYAATNNLWENTYDKIGAT